MTQYQILGVFMNKFLIACAASAVLSTVVVAESNVQVFGGYNIADTDCVFEDAGVVGVNVETFFNQNVGVRAGYERLLDPDLNPSKNASISNGDTSVGVNRFSLNGVLKKAKAWKKITPYVLAGGGYESFENVITGANGTSSCGGQWFLDAGVGAQVALTDRLTLNPEVRVLRKDKCETIDVTPTLGLAYAFGGGTRIVEKVVVKEVIKEVIKEVPVEKIVTITTPAPMAVAVDACPIPTNFTDRCDNTYYVQVASELKCTDCDQSIKNIALINKLDNNGLTHRDFVSTNPSGTQVNRLLVGPYKCKKDAFEALCEIKKTINCDAFVYSTRK